MKIPRGMTLIELVIVVLLISIMSVVVATRINTTAPAKLVSAGERLIADLNNARRLAVTEHRIYAVDFTGNSYSVRYLDDETGELADVVCPHTGKEEYVMDFSAGGQFMGVSIASVDFGGGSQVRFGSFGEPSGAGGGALAEDGHITLEYRGREFSISVIAGTGSVVREQ